MSDPREARQEIRETLYRLEDKHGAEMVVEQIRIVIENDNAFRAFR